VHAINAAIAVLKGAPAPAPFNIANRRIALLMLAHFVGDIHQPLHVGAVYLDPTGRLVDPDAGGPPAPATETAGGNAIRMNGANMHTTWDGIPSSVALPFHDDVVAAARAMPPMTGPVEGWAAAWATESLGEARKAFTDVSFGPFDHQHWDANVGSKYREQRAEIQRVQVIKAGARLAQLLNLLLPQ
jgi:hypothetical protein